jgi:hypothetical protein
MRHLPLLLLLLLAPAAGAQRPHAEPISTPSSSALPRPEVVAGELSTQRFRILHTQRAAGAARALAERIESVRDAFAQVLGRDWPGVTELRVGVGREEFEALALPGGKPPGWAVGLAYPGANVVLLDALVLNGPEGETTLRHELAHVALGQVGSGWPRWFQEGLAQHLTGESYSVTHYTALFRAVTQERVFFFEHLTEDWPDLPADVEVAYAQSAAFVAHLARGYGPQSMGRLLDLVAEGKGFNKAFGIAFQTSISVEEKHWREGLALRYGWLPLTTSTSLLWLGASLLVVAAWWRRRRQKAARLEEMSREEAQEEEALRQLAADTSPDPFFSPEQSPWDPGYPLPQESEGEEDDESSGEQRPPKPTLH